MTWATRVSSALSTRLIRCLGLNMTVYNWSTLTNNQQIAFNPSTDKLTFDSSSISATSLYIWWSNTVSTTFIYGSQTVTLLTDVRSISTSNVSFANGSLLIIGDNTIGTITDDTANSLTGSSNNDALYGLGGNDIISAGAGNDSIQIGYAYGGVGNDTIDGGEGSDSLIYISDNMSTPAVTVNLANHMATSLQGTLTLSSIEAVFGTNQNDSFSGGDLSHGLNSLGNITSEKFWGGPGNDTIIGAANSDIPAIADYSNKVSNQIVIADLKTGFVIDGLGGIDTLFNVREIRGGVGNDQLTGGGAYSIN